MSSPGGEQMVLQLAYFDRSRKPVVMEIGPMLAVEDVAGGKVFTRYGLGPRQVAVLRERSVAWPRTADAESLEMNASELERQDPEAAP